jgi:hypothetical protein
MKVTILYSKSRLKFPVGSWLIRVIEADKFTHPLAGSHVSFCATIGGQRAMFESVSPLSRIISVERWAEHHESVGSWEIETDASESEIIGWMLENSSKKYSRFQCVLIGVGEMFGGWVNALVRKQNPNGSEYLICVEAVSRFLIAFAGFKFEQSPDMIGLKEFIDRMDARKVA